MKRLLVAVLGTIIFYVISCGILLGASALGKAKFESNVVWILAGIFTIAALILLIIFALSGKRKPKDTGLPRDLTEAGHVEK